MDATKYSKNLTFHGLANLGVVRSTIKPNSNDIIKIHVNKKVQIIISVARTNQKPPTLLMILSSAPQKNTTQSMPHPKMLNFNRIHFNIITKTTTTAADALRTSTTINNHVESSSTGFDYASGTIPHSLPPLIERHYRKGLSIGGQSQLSSDNSTKNIRNRMLIYIRPHGLRNESIAAAQSSQLGGDSTKKYNHTRILAESRNVDNPELITTTPTSVNSIKGLSVTTKAHSLSFAESTSSIYEHIASTDDIQATGDC